MVSIRLENVRKSFDQTVAVDGVSLQVEPGELFFLLGPSGCGKTTILRILAGFCEPEEGEIYFDDRPLTNVHPSRRNAGLVFQNYALWPHMSVAENVAYGLEERRVPKEERERLVARALETMKMEKYADRRPTQLSGGQQQRVALARALVIEPDVVLMDEPLSNLDARLRLQMRHEIRRIHRETGVTMLYVTHDQKEALSMADRIAVMSMGRVEQVGDPRTVYRHPANRFVANFIGEANLFHGKLTGIEESFGRFNSGLGDFRGRLTTEATSDGGDVQCMVRPECLRLDGSAENAFRATVTECVYLGELEEYWLEANGRKLQAVMANPGEDAPAVGQTVDVSFAADDAVIFPVEDEGSGQ
jgi:iron(III) transport system ATP-binding protein